MKNLVAYLTSAYPDKNFSIDLALAMSENGVDSIELGVPFSDPVADGPVIEKANHLSLEKGFTFQDLTDISKAIAPKVDTLWMGYMNPFYHRGMENTVQTASNLGISAMIIPDLPHEETLVYKDLLSKNGVDIISFVAPTDSHERIATITKDAKKFIYLVAYAGITGSGQSEDLAKTIDSIRQSTQTPVYVGFGVNEKTAKDKAKGADGVIVGSAFVDILLKENLTSSQKIDMISVMARNIKESINS